MGLEYKAPTERTDGRAVIVKSLASPQSGKLPLVEESSSEEYVLPPAKKVVKKVVPAKALLIEDDSEDEDEGENIVLDKTTHDLIDLFKKNCISHLKKLNEKRY